MDEALTALLEATSRFEYLIAKKEYKKLVNLMTLNIEEGDIFRRCQLKPHEKLIKNMLHKCDEIDLAVEACAQEHNDWTVGSSTQGITVKHMVDEKGFINLKVEGTLENLPLYSQMVVIWEVALYHLWVPYCSDSRIIKSFDNSEFITTMTLNPPFGITRDIVVHAFGANCLTDQNSIVLVTKSLTDSAYDKEITSDVTIPPVNKGFFSDRVHLHHLYCVNTMTSPTSIKFSAVMKLDPKLSMGLPASIMNWFINQLAGVVFPLLRKQAIYLAEADPYNSSYTNQIRDSSVFYVDFLLPIYRAYVQKQGWTQPVIRCLYEKGVPQKGFDYSNPFTPSERESTQQQLQHQKLLIRLPPTTPSSSPSSSPRKKKMGGVVGRQTRHFSSSSSDSSADFFSCLDDEEQFRDRKFSHDHIASNTAVEVRGRAPLFAPEEAREDSSNRNCNSSRGLLRVLVGGEGVQEPFLAGREGGRGTKSESEGGDEGAEDDSSSRKGWNCCRWRLLCCC